MEGKTLKMKGDDGHVRLDCPPFMAGNMIRRQNFQRLVGACDPLVMGFKK